MLSPFTRGNPSRLLCALALSPALALGAPPDCSSVTRENLIACAQANSPLLEAELASSRAAEGRREAARPFLPSNPTVSGSLGSRATATDRAVNWSVTVAQELEIAGQSGLRVDSAERELTAQGHHVAVVRAELAEQVWLAWFELLAAQERQALTARLERAALAVAATAQGMAKQGLSAPVDAAVADAAAVEASRASLTAAQQRAAGELRLRTLLGAPGRLEISGALEPLPASTQTSAARPEVLALEALKGAAARRVELLRRTRVPNPTLSLFAQNDGFDERVFGVGLALPLPLPQPLGRTQAGELAEALGQEARLQAELGGLTRTLASERELARSAYDTGLASRALYSTERVERAREGLTAIAEQLAASRLTVREALTSQRALMELLQSELEVRQALCVASVRLVRANGGSLEGGAL